jgi:hypothetical protein
MTKPRNASESSTTSAETATTENPQSQTEHFDNEALERCVNAWHRNFKLASINPSDDNLHCVEDNDENVFAIEQAGNAYRDAMPLLLSYENIRDFIACTTYGTLNRVFDLEECRELLGAAKIAMALLKAQPKTQPPPA